AVAARLPGGDPDGDGEVGAGRLAPRRDHLGGERRAAGHRRPAVLVGPQVDRRPEELVEEVAVAGVDLYAVGTSLLRVNGAPHEGLPDRGEFGGAGRPAERLFPGRPTRGAERGEGGGRRAGISRPPGAIAARTWHRPPGGPRRHMLARRSGFGP